MSQRFRREKAAAVQNNSKWRLAGFITAGIVATVLVFGLIVLALILHTTPPPVIHTDPAAAQRLQKEIDHAQVAAASGTPGVVSADETELNSVLKEYLKGTADKMPANSPAIVRDMKMNLFKDRLRLYLLANYGGKDVSFLLEGKLHTLNGYLDFEPTSGKIGALPMPKSSLKRAMDQMLSTPEGRATARLPRNLRDLYVENGKLVVVFR